MIENELEITIEFSDIRNDLNPLFFSTMDAEYLLDMDVDEELIQGLINYSQRFGISYYVEKDFDEVIYHFSNRVWNYFINESQHDYLLSIQRRKIKDIVGISSIKKVTFDNEC